MTLTDETIDVKGSFALPVLKLRRMVALSETFQREAGCQEHAAALDRVHLHNAIGNPNRPNAVVSPGDGHDYTLKSGGAQNYLRPSGSIFLYLSIDTPQEYYSDTVRAELYSGTFFGQVMDEVVSLSNADDPGSSDGTSHLSIAGATQIAFDESSEDDWESMGRFYWCGYLVRWGDS